MRVITGRHRPGQALVEFALIFPVFLVLLMSIITYGLYVFYNQQLSNAAREAARYAAVHSSTAQCPTVSRLDPPPAIKPKSYVNYCDPPPNWPHMTDAARSKIWGMDPGQVSLTACWSGYVDASNNYDAWPPTSPNQFTDCTMRNSPTSLTAIDPRVDASALACPAVTIGSSTTPATADGDDKASDTAVDTSIGNHYPTTVTVYSCFNWTPPMAGFVVIPNQITLRAVISETLQRQQ
jgi:TadE-like protein